MQRVSTNLTLFYKFFIPVFWIVFFGSVTAAVLLIPFKYIANFPASTVRIAVVLFFLSGVAILWLTLLRLKRVEMDEHFVYVTNYFKNFRYPYHNIERIEVSRFLFFRVATIYFREPGSFGKSATFVPSGQLYDDFMDTHPEVKRAVKN